MTASRNRKKAASVAQTGKTAFSMTPKEDRQYTILKAVFRILGHLPKPFMEILATGIGLVWYAVDARHRNLAMENLTIAFADSMSLLERKRLCKRNFIQFARLFLEFPRLSSLNRETLDAFVTVEGAPHLEAAIATKKPVFMLSAHFGNWELMAQCAPIWCDTPVEMIVRPLDFRPLDRIVTEIRSHTGNHIIPKKKAGSAIRKVLREGGFVGILVDQRATPKEKVDVPFFGKLAPTNKGLAVFAARHDILVLPVFNHRRPDGRYHVTIDPPVRIDKTGDLESDVVANTARFTQIIESHIRKHPENWFWVHSRYRKYKKRQTP